MQDSHPHPTGGERRNAGEDRQSIKEQNKGFKMSFSGIKSKINQFYFLKVKYRVVIINVAVFLRDRG